MGFTLLQKQFWTDFLVFIVFLTSPTLVVADGGARIGNGGDWRYMMMSYAEREAANWTLAASKHPEFIENLSLESASLLHNFLTYPDALKRLANDIVNSPRIYLRDGDERAKEYESCAWTNDPQADSLDDVVVTLKHCEHGLRESGQVFANRTVIHESVHHLLRAADFKELIVEKFTGDKRERERQEEVFCDRVAEAVHQLFEFVVLSQTPHWRDIAFPVIETPSRAGGSSEYSVFEPRGFHLTSWTGETGDARTANRLLVWGGCHEGETTIYACGDDSYFNNGAIYDPLEDSWSAMSKGGAPSPRAEALGIWTGNQKNEPYANQLIVWGGCSKGDGCEIRHNDGAFYDPLTNKWKAIAASSAAPAPRVNHAGVWTGEELIVWGGNPAYDDTVFAPPPLGDGGVYHPEKGWRPIRDGLKDAPEARSHHSAIWTGRTGNRFSSERMLVLGGCNGVRGDACAQPYSGGALFDPKTMTWAPLIAEGQPPSARHNESVLYVASQAKLYVYGGIDRRGQVIGDGHILDLKTMQWQRMAHNPVGRFQHSAVWANDKMLVFGGKVFNHSTRQFALAEDVIAYVPRASHTSSRDKWIRYETEEVTPLKTFEHSAVWTGYSMLIWGGQIYDRGFTSGGSQFFPGRSPR